MPRLANKVALITGAAGGQARGASHHYGARLTGSALGTEDCAARSSSDPGGFVPMSSAQADADDPAKVVSSAEADVIPSPARVSWTSWRAW